MHYALATTAGSLSSVGIVPSDGMKRPPDPVAVTATPNTRVDPARTLPSTRQLRTLPVWTCRNRMDGRSNGNKLFCRNRLPGWSLEYSTDGGGSWSAVAPATVNRHECSCEHCIHFPSASSRKIADMSSTGCCHSVRGDGYNAIL